MATARKLIHGSGLHVEANRCVVNIRENLEDMKGREVTYIEILSDNYAGENKWKLYGCANNRVVQLKTVVGES